MWRRRIRIPMIVEATIQEVRLEMSGIQGTIGSGLSGPVIGRSVDLREGAPLYFAGEEYAGYPHGVGIGHAYLHFQPGTQPISRSDSGLKTIPFLPIQILSKHLTLYFTAPNSNPLRGQVGSTNGRFSTGAFVIDCLAQVSFAPERNPFSRSFASP